MIPKIARFLLHLLGWQVIGEPAPYKKYVIAVAPHTSNWDFLYGYLGALVLQFDIHFIAKASLFRGPKGALTRMLGGIPVDREQRSNLVARMVAEFDRHETFGLAVPPSGTRRATDYWKSGFYYIALGAGAPIILTVIDYGRKQVGVKDIIMPTGDVRADMARIREAFADASGKYPRQKSAIRLRQEDEE